MYIFTQSDFDELLRELKGSEYESRVQALGLDEYEFSFEFNGYTHYITCNTDTDDITFHVDIRAMIGLSGLVYIDVPHIRIEYLTDGLDEALRSSSNLNISCVSVLDSRQVITYDSYSKYLNILKKNTSSLNSVYLSYVNYKVYNSLVSEGVVVKAELLSLVYDNNKDYSFLKEPLRKELKCLELNIKTDDISNLYSELDQKFIGFNRTNINLNIYTYNYDCVDYEAYMELVDTYKQVDIRNVSNWKVVSDD